MQRTGRSAALLWTLFGVVATARLLLQFSGMPPYAGLDEIFHVARLEFVAGEGRNPTALEPSIPPHLERSIRRDPQAVPAFGVIAADWPEVVAAGMRMPAERSLTETDRRPYRLPNYEAQQPSLYYSLAAPFARLLAAPTALDELRVWRMLSLLFAIVTVACTGWIGWRLAGAYGLLAASLLASTPTWLTIVTRAGNDAMACAALAVAIAVTASRPQGGKGGVAEGVAWGTAFAVKLYTWPAAAALLLFWIWQRAGRRRVIVAVAIGTIFVALTTIDLRNRTSSAMGMFAFDEATATPGASPDVDVLEMAKMTIATAVWTSGQHWNAMRAIPMAIYAGPILLLVLLTVTRRGRSEEDRRLFLVVGAAVLLMLIGQIVNVLAYLRHAPPAGSSLPAGGKEGWYYFALAPLLYGIIGTMVLRDLRAFRSFVLAVVVWCACWDVVIHERGLFLDWRGETSPRQPSAILRWGPVVESQRAAIPDHEFAVGPFAGHPLELRGLHLASLLALTVLGTRRERAQDA